MKQKKGSKGLREYKFRRKSNGTGTQDRGGFHLLPSVREESVMLQYLVLVAKARVFILVGDAIKLGTL